MQKIYAGLPKGIAACLSDRKPAPYSSASSMDNYVSQSRGQQFAKTGEPTVRLVESVMRLVGGEYRCETSAAAIEFKIEDSE